MDKTRLLKSALYSIAVIAAAAGGLAAMSALSTKPPPAEQIERTYSVRAEAVEIGNIRPKLSVFGTIEARNHADLTSPVAAQVLATPFLEGTAFRKGDRLVRLDLRDLQYQRDENLAAADSITAQIRGVEEQAAIERERLAEIATLLDLSRQQYERSERLFEQKVIPQTQLETAEAALRQAEIDQLTGRQSVSGLETDRLRLEAEQRQALSRLDQLDFVIEQARLLAPFDGNVLQVNASVGDRTTAGEVVIEIFEPESVIMRASIPSSYLSRITRSERTEVILDDPDGTTLTLEVDYLKPEIGESQGSAEGIIRLPERGWILGSIVGADLILEDVPGSVALPYESLYSGNRIFRVDGDQRAESVDCEVVGPASVSAEVSHALLTCERLRPGDLVVTQQVPNLATGFKLVVAN